MKNSMFPARLELEVLRGESWVVEVSYAVNDDSQFLTKFQYLKSMYPLKNKQYQIVFYANSKVNNIYKEGVVETTP
jgi:hypothetical protein